MKQIKVNDKNSKLIEAVITILLGVLCIALKGQIISIALTILGVVLIVLGILDIVNSVLNMGIIKIVVGAVVIVFGWAFVTVALYVIGVLLILYGLLALVNKIKLRVHYTNVVSTVISYSVQVVSIIIGLFLLFNQGGTVNWVFIVAGIFSIIEGLLLLVDACKKD